MTLSPVTLGATVIGANRCAFEVWAPAATKLEVHLVTPVERLVPMAKDKQGYCRAVVDELPPGSDYFYRINQKKEYPDPASRWQPAGVHGPSRVTDPGFGWTDASWTGLPLRDYVLYELHVGTFSEAGTFDGVLPHLGRLRDLGITALELMPVAEFPGNRNWGYDGVLPFAVHNGYGGSAGLKRLVNGAHEHGLAVVLDVVYNHLGPEGNCLAEFGPYFTDFYRTPWGAALNFDGAFSDDVRRFFKENALLWQTEFHLDALRLDAVHAIHDFSPIPFLEDLAETCHRQALRLNRPFHLIAESDLNMSRHILPQSLGGYGLDAQWSDDFHHSLHVLLTGERDGYYADYAGVRPLAKVWREGYAYTGEYSQFRKRRHGSSPHHNPVKQFVVCSQNHDQIGNRQLGDRLNSQLTFEQQKLAAGTVLLSPFVPLLFMGEEYGETAPFLYFISHTNPALVEAVRTGRQREFAAQGWTEAPLDPQDEATFQKCKLNHALAKHGQHRVLQAFYRELLRLRRELRAIGRVEKDTLKTLELDEDDVLGVRQWHKSDEVILLFNFSREPRVIQLPMLEGAWLQRLNSAAQAWGGPGSNDPDGFHSGGSISLTLPPSACLIYQRQPSEPGAKGAGA